ncbi:hypothetical protein SUGI_0697510 [Cryptomeria japonica]|nr:hypothetical protein SUGI_0697510 [Cryptomeria japonica]
MNSEIWSSLPEEIIVLVLAKLPTLTIGRFRAVCKQWKSLLSPSLAFQRITPFVHPCSTPAFLIGRLHPSHWVNSLNSNLYLLQSLPNSHMYRLSLDFLAPDSINVVTACKSVLCCSKNGAPTSFYICNPVTKTCKELPPSIQLRQYDFVGLAFDVSTRLCILVIGRTVIMAEENHMVVEIYDSEINSWTTLQIKTPKTVYPLGEGVYSRGTFYWINSTYLGVSRCRFDVAAFHVKERHWDVIRHPQRPYGPYSNHLYYWRLSGYDGKVVLVYTKGLCLWELDEDNRDEEENRQRWLELAALPKKLCGEVRCGGVVNDISSQRCTQVVVNSSGWILVHLPRNKLVVFDGLGRMMQSIEGRQLTTFTQTYPTSVRAFEVNNVWWP